MERNLKKADLGGTYNKTAMHSKKSTYSKTLQHSLTNAASSHCAHNLVLQVKRAAAYERHSVLPSCHADAKCKSCMYDITRTNTS